MIWYDQYIDDTHGENTGECSGQRLLDTHTDTLEDCKQLCKNDPNCGYLSYPMKNKGSHCILYHKDKDDCHPDKNYPNYMTSYKKIQNSNTSPADNLIPRDCHQIRNKNE